MKKTDHVVDERRIPEGGFPPLRLPARPPFDVMEARVAKEIPAGQQWVYEPKWDGFRCLVFREHDEVLLQSKAGQPLGRYFPELVEQFRRLPVDPFVLDGEIVIFLNGHLSFDDLLLRIHPAASRIRKLSAESPASFIAFDMLVDGEAKSLLKLPLSERRQRLEAFAGEVGMTTANPEHPARGYVPLLLSPVTRDRNTSQRWISELAGGGFDGVMAKLADASYASGERSAMMKIKRIRSADCVVGGFRYSSKGGDIGSLLLGLYNDSGELDHVGFTSSFNSEQRKKLKAVVEPLRGGQGFTGRAPGGPSRWSTERSGQWESLHPRLVCEVAYDHFSQGRFRHGTKFLRWRPEKKPRQCTFDQVRPEPSKAEGTKSA